MVTMSYINVANQKLNKNKKISKSNRKKKIKKQGKKLKRKEEDLTCGPHTFVRTKHVVTNRLECMYVYTYIYKHIDIRDARERASLYVLNVSAHKFIRINKAEIKKGEKNKIK